MSGMVTMGAKARIGEASIVVAVLAAIPGLMIFDWIYWWAGRRWGRNAIDLFVGNHPKAAARTARLERIIHRFGWLAIVIAYFQPVPNVLIYAAAGWTRMRLRTFLLLDLIGSPALDRAVRRARLRDRPERGRRRQGRLALRAVGDDRPGGRDRRPPVAASRRRPRPRAQRPLTIVPRTSPNDTLPAAPRITTVSPSARNGRPSSISEPSLPGVGPEIVPLANRSPGRHGRAVDGRVGELLRERPVEAARVRAADDLAVELELEREVERPVALRSAGTGSGSGSCSRAGTR